MKEQNDNMKKGSKPHGEVLTQTIAMPADANADGDIFGGWIMSQMDLGGGILAKQIAKSRVVTVAVKGMTFHCPVLVGDTVTCFGRCTRLGKTSMDIHIETWVHRGTERELLKVTEGLFIFVAIDENRRPKLIDRECALC